MNKQIFQINEFLKKNKKKYIYIDKQIIVDYHVNIGDDSMIPFEVQTGKFPDMEKRWLQPCVDFSAHEFYRAQKWHGVPANKN